MKSRLFITLADFLVILLFGYTAIEKIENHHRFVFQMHLSPFVPVASLAVVLGVVVPFVELSIAAMISIRPLANTGRIAALALLSIFEIYIAGMVLSGKHLPCACGGVIAFMSWNTHLLFNAFFMLLIGLTLFITRKQYPKNNEITYSRV